MATWKSRGLRGSALEDLINETNEKYKETGLAIVQKIPTPITPIKMNPSKNQITLAFFEQKSTVDYIGVVQGVPICFDAKECKEDRFPLQNIHAHQVDFMEHFEKQGGVSFFIIHYTHKDIMIYLPFDMFKFFWDRSNNGGRKSFLLSELNPDFVINQNEGVFVPYLVPLKKDIEERDIVH
ncbi:MAG: Holliday junction resolvase RecU [Lachnospiraceae bacterium]|nr:Holliday junction resolvase RecU [Lachnospiraceae bacterium]